MSAVLGGFLVFAHVITVLSTHIRLGHGENRRRMLKYKYGTVAGNQMKAIIFLTDDGDGNFALCFINP